MTHAQMFTELLRKMREYHPSKEFSIINEVYEFAVIAHGEQLRKNGEPYMIHPMSVALILADIKSDIETIAAGILHDVVEDTACSAEELKTRFGEEITELVKGVTKLQHLQYVSKEEEQAENFRQLFFAMADDIRVILIKMADRLHNLRTLQHMSREHQIKKAQETLDIYAPLAHRLGISKIRYQLEDLSFKYLMPTEYADLADKMKYKLASRQKFILDIVDALKKRLDNEHIDAKVVGRSKHMFSIYKKMVSQNKSIDEIFDILAIRVIVTVKEDCYTVLGIIHDMYRPVPGRIKDYIAMPKGNNYQSLHTTALSGGRHFEVQVRTWEMDKVAEYGIAAHWKYKQRKGGIIDDKSEEEKFAWLRQIIEWQMDMSDNKEYLSAVKDDFNIYKSHVYCFSPKGEVVSLLSGSTPIDFAYAIHSAIGNKMVGARVNNNIVPFEYELKNGDQVEIITSNNSRGPSMDWLKIVKSAQAKNKINQWFRKQNKDENILKGKTLLEKEAVRKRADLNELISNKKWLESVFNRYGLSDWDAICASVGHGGIKEGQIINRLLEERQKELKEKEFQENPIETILSKASHTGDVNKKDGILIQGIPDMSLRLSRCCRPVPGDEIIGFVTRGRGVTIHRTDCTGILTLSEDDRTRLLDARWDAETENASYRTDIRVLCGNRRNLLTDISRALTEMENIRVVNFQAKYGSGDAVVNISVEIKNKDQLDKMSLRLKNISGVYEVNRICG